MGKNKAKLELLAPAGSFPSLYAAIDAGADAVYFGLNEFNMRQGGAKNFKLTDLPKIKKACEEKNVKRYLTLNTIIYDDEIKKIEEIIKKAKQYVDAIICWDLSVIQLCKKHKVGFHISTQASVSNIEAAKFYKKLGAKRIVLARELDLKQIKKISKIIDVETFAHGAMCVAVSGRCLMSQFVFGKSANRGECLQVCRRSYNIVDDSGKRLKITNKNVLSPKDLCTLPFIEKLKEAGIKSFKIEGRAREPEYVDIVVREYRNALNKKLTKQEIKESIERLKTVYNKGFSSGFYLGVPSSDDFSKLEHSSATQKKQWVARVEHYYPKIKVALIKMLSGRLDRGDKVILIHPKKKMIRAKIERLEIEHKPVKSVKKGQKFGIRIPEARKGYNVYKIVKR
jgi:putative protease